MRQRELPAAHEYHLFGCMAVCALTTVLIAFAILMAAWTTRERWITDVDPIASARSRHGRELIMRYGCTSCHVLPITGPEGMVGPPLTHIGSQSYIAGRFPNEEIWMTLWIQNPQRLKPGTGMPDLNIGERDARDIATYLATLR
jgi:cytochrome c